MNTRQPPSKKEMFIRFYLPIKTIEQLFKLALGRESLVNPRQLNMRLIRPSIHSEESDMLSPGPQKCVAASFPCKYDIDKTDKARKGKEGLEEGRFICQRSGGEENESRISARHAKMRKKRRGKSGSQNEMGERGRGRLKSTCSRNSCVCNYLSTCVYLPQDEMRTRPPSVIVRDSVSTTKSGMTRN